MYFKCKSFGKQDISRVTLQTAIIECGIYKNKVNKHLDTDLALEEER